MAQVHERLPATSLLLIATAFRALGRSNRYERARTGGAERPGLAPALTASLLGFVVGAFFLTLAYSEMLFTLVALAIALQKVTVGAAGRAVAVEATR